MAFTLGIILVVVLALVAAVLPMSKRWIPALLMVPAIAVNIFTAESNWARYVIAAILVADIVALVALRKRFRKD
jgi:hypothetical protein